VEGDGHQGHQNRDHHKGLAHGAQQLRQAGQDRTASSVKMSRWW
jgi:hypothetical protein